MKINLIAIGSVGVAGAVGLAAYFFTRKMPVAQVQSTAASAAQHPMAEPIGIFKSISDGATSFVSSTVLGIKNNNPGNLKWNSVNNWVGQVGKDSQGHIIFDKPEHGIRALNRNLNTYANTGRNTARTIIFGTSTLAGWAEGNRESYIKLISQFTGKGVDTVLGSGDRLNLIKAIIKMENGSIPYTDSFITAAMALP